MSREKSIRPYGGGDLCLVGTVERAWMKTTELFASIISISSLSGGIVGIFVLVCSVLLAIALGFLFEMSGFSSSAGTVSLVTRSESVSDTSDEGSDMTDVDKTIFFAGALCMILMLTIVFGVVVGAGSGLCTAIAIMAFFERHRFLRRWLEIGVASVNGLSAAILVPALIIALFQLTPSISNISILGLLSGFSAIGYAFTGRRIASWYLNETTGVTQNA